MIKYAAWFWQQMKDIKVKILVRIVAGLAQVGLGLLLVWLCRRFIDVVIWRGNILHESLVLFGVIALLIALRQLVFYLSSMTEVEQQNNMRLRLFNKVLGRKLYTSENDLHSGDVSQRLEKDIASVAAVTTSILPGMVVTGVQLIALAATGGVGMFVPRQGRFCHFLLMNVRFDTIMIRRFQFFERTLNLRFIERGAACCRTRPSTPLR